MDTLTAGTYCYDIPLPSHYKLTEPFQLIIKTNKEGVVIECPVFDEYGYGKDYSEAMKDLGQSIVDFHKSLRRLKKRRKNMGDSLRFVFDNMEKYIVSQ